MRNRNYGKLLIAMFKLSGHTEWNLLEEKVSKVHVSIYDQIFTKFIERKTTKRHGFVEVKII